MLQSILALILTSSSSLEEIQLYNQQANALVDRTQLEILKLLKELTLELKEVEATIPKQLLIKNQPTIPMKTLDNKRKKHHKTDKYC